LETPTASVKKSKSSIKKSTSKLSAETALQDYALCCESRQASLIGRKEVFSGKAKFGIFGDGKELPQAVMARYFEPGDFRSGYYRDQTFMMAIGALSSKSFFAQLYAHASLEADPSSAGRQMSSHFATRMLDEKGEWLELSALKNSTSDVSPTASQMPRLLGLAFASKLFKENKDLHAFAQFSKKGREVAFGTIGNASTSEGMFFESINAAGVLQVPMLVSVWDDDYGISVPREYHTTKGSISEVLRGFETSEGKPGFEIFTVRGWDYEALHQTYAKAVKCCREEHKPVLVHVTELTQPQGHSTSGSHERYKSKDRLAWEKEFDCIAQMRNWLLATGNATEKELIAIESEAAEAAKTARNDSWKDFVSGMKLDFQRMEEGLNLAISSSYRSEDFAAILNEFKEAPFPVRSDVWKAVHKAIRISGAAPAPVRTFFSQFRQDLETQGRERYSSHLYSQSAHSALLKQEVLPAYEPDATQVDGREILQAYFDKTFAANPLVFAIGEDVGKIGDVNQGFAGLQEKYGEIRISDTGIRECTIAGQGIGAAMRGLRPIVEIQYLDYLLYALQILSDDLATIQYRTKGGQKAPLIVRTRGHRLEGVWHAGSPMGVILHALRGMYVFTPRNMTKAAACYNTLLQSDEPGLIIECLNGYRLKESMPSNLEAILLPPGKVEVIREGSDLTILTYGSMTRICIEAATMLEELGIKAEVIDAQCLLPFDLAGETAKSIEKTSRLLIADEDVPGGASAYLLQEVLEKQNAYRFLDSKPQTLTAQAHRPAYSSDGDCFSKPGADEVFEAAYAMMHEALPGKFPALI
jgi:pyruvate/2-oxoglutarate/acetoin dehydrogenase E1 component/TPP-dependent pyruvate/acetoin dehydrogenase alpha subunit